MKAILEQSAKWPDGNEYTVQQVLDIANNQSQFISKSDWRDVGRELQSRYGLSDNDIRIAAVAWSHDKKMGIVIGQAMISGE